MNRIWTWLLPVWLLLGLGLGLRFANLLGKPVWLDEAFTLLQVSGFRQPAVIQHLLAGAPVSLAELLSYHKLHHSWSEMLQVIALDSPQLPPLHFILLRLWMQLWGDGVWVMRSLSALISLAIFPAIYWLCLELFAAPIIGWYAMALVAVSPFHLSIAQEIRPYSLWALSLLLIVTLYFRALRRSRWRDWLGFSAALLIGAYTHLFTILLWFVCVCHSLLIARFRWTHSLRRLTVAMTIASIGFLPWVWWGFIALHGQGIGISTKPHQGHLGLLKGVIQGISRFFWDINVNTVSPWPLVIIYLIGVAAVWTIVGISLRYGQRYMPKPVWQFLGLMLLIPMAVLVISDLLVNGNRASFTRYYLPSAIAAEIAVAYFIAAQHTAYLIAAQHTRKFRATAIQMQWQRRLIALLLIGVVSSVNFIIAPTWWSKSKTEANQCIAQITAEAPQPLIITDEFYLRSLALAHQLSPTVHFQFLPIGSWTAPQLDASAQSYFLYMPSKQFLQAMTHRYHLRSVCPPYLWQINQKPPAISRSFG